MRGHILAFDSFQRLKVTTLRLSMPRNLFCVNDLKLRKHVCDETTPIVGIDNISGASKRAIYMM